MTLGIKVNDFVGHASCACQTVFMEHGILFPNVHKI